MNYLGIDPLEGVGERVPLSLSRHRQDEIKTSRIRHQSESNEQGSQQQGILREPKSLEQAVQDINQQLKVFDRRLHYRIDQDTKKVVVKVINVESGETVRQIPPDQVLKAAKLIHELRGLLIDELV